MYGAAWRLVLNTPIEDTAEERVANNDNNATIVHYLQSFKCDDNDVDQVDAHSFLLAFVCPQKNGTTNNEESASISQSDDDSDYSDDPLNALYWSNQEEGGNTEEMVTDGTSKLFVLLFLAFETNIFHVTFVHRCIKQ